MSESNSSASGTQQTTTTAAPSSSTSALPQPQVSPRLYLYTFLATLLLLIFVSLFIVSRSYILRRRFRLQFEEALRNGHVLAPIPGQRRRAIGPKPKLWDVWITTSENRWLDMMPLSAELVPIERILQSEDHSSHQQTLKNRFWRVNRRASRERPNSSNQVAPHIPTPQAVALTEQQETIRIAALIAMPSQSRPMLVERGSSSSSSSVLKGKSADRLSCEDGFSTWDRIPPIMFGVTDVELKWEKRTVDAVSETHIDHTSNSSISQ